MMKVKSLNNVINEMKQQYKQIEERRSRYLYGL